MNRSQCLKAQIIVEINEKFKSLNIDEFKLKPKIQWICDQYDEIFETSIIEIGYDIVTQDIVFCILEPSNFDVFDLDILNVEILEQILEQLSK